MIDEQLYYCEFKPNSHNITLSFSRPIRLRVSDRWGWIMRRERLHLKQVRTDRSFPITSVLIYEVRSADRFFPGTRDKQDRNNQWWSEQKLQEYRRTKDDEEVKYGENKAALRPAEPDELHVINYENMNDLLIRAADRNREMSCRNHLNMKCLLSLI